MTTKTIVDADIKGKTVLMRVDFNVPLRDGRIESDRRIVQALPSIKLAIEHGAKLVLMSHLGRPAENGFEAMFSLRPVAERLGELLKRKVTLGPPEVVGEELNRMVAGMANGDVILLENLRFHPGETMPDKAKKAPDKKLTSEQQKIHDSFVASLAGLGEVYVNDAFGTCHRKHASMYGVAKAVQAKGGPAVAGFLLEKEIRYLSDALAKPKRPYIAILGGAKVSDKIKLISALLGKVDRILIGGAMAYTLLKAIGANVGKSLVEDNEVVQQMKALLEGAGDKILLPCDHVATGKFDFKKMIAGNPIITEDVNIPESLMGMDIGPRTIEVFSDVVSSAGTIIWNGPLGVAELEDYANGTTTILMKIIQATENGAVSIIGGGDSAAIVEKLELESTLTHVSTGGGASLEYLEGKPMPPIEVLGKI